MMSCGVVNDKLQSLYGAHSFTISRTLTGYLSPSLGLKFSDVPGGLAAISKVPALSLENGEYFGKMHTRMTYHDRQ